MLKHGSRATVLETSDELYVITTEEGSTVRKHLDHVVLSTSRSADQSDEPALSVESGETGEDIADKSPEHVVARTAQIF